MSWLANLVEIYDNSASLIGQFAVNRWGQEYALLPISHTTQNAQIEVTISEDGNFVSARVVEKNDASTIIPCTETSANRTSKAVPHPLFDKLPYVAGDYMKYGGDKKKEGNFADYIQQLQEWCESEFAHPKVKSVCAYLKEARLVGDLIESGVITVDENNRFIEKWSKEQEEVHGEKPELYGVTPANQSDSFVRFKVNVFGDKESRLWRDHSVYESFTQFYKEKLGSDDLCYVAGKYLPATERHSSRIRHSADQAKLISANDSSGFTFRGRFSAGNEAANISYDVSQKAHNALKWLIQKQGVSFDGKTFLVWSNDQSPVPEPFEDTENLFADEEDEAIGDVTYSEYARQLHLALNGYRHDLNTKAEVNILVLDAATPGRMAVVYYRNLEKEFYLDRIRHWHETCNWLHRYKRNEEKRKIIFRGAPAFKDIAFAAFGGRADNRLVKEVVERLLPCVVDGRPVPRDIVKKGIQRTSNPVAFEWSKGNSWEWEKTLSIVCALVRKQFETEGYDVALDQETTQRDYLFGRMLAVADVLERRALDQGEGRPTNAIRYMNAFSQRPVRTWTIIQSNLQPYQAKLGGKGTYLSKILDEIGSKINIEDYTDKPLSGLYLLGYYSQRHELYKKKESKEETEQIQS
ncbi:type I-C CRISPR-associated protein Cas8c/Csd1 [Indiicoccus explosivorum]|uniref:type I-C CRISPR-associated protein Cas8c/Csd1 n=1 Tax=Indiicoccus explosivorum TaxID=1917864 RepID=UPI000B43E924|nr:type I-C CRISPR-associated protein Cas8c/Csd1 [Indiicoccus explosivorum]